MLIREAASDDWPAIWKFFRPIVADGETFPYDPEMDDHTGRTVVAVADDGTVIGSANMYANREGGGAHIASASFMVDPAHHGRGTGRALGDDALKWARSRGFHGMQFNAVVESNTRAVRLWKSLGFEIIGTIPEGFRHPTEGYVGLHVMYRRL